MAISVNPKRAARRARIRNASAQLNMIVLLLR
jgi:hypothetical protein